LQIFTASQKIRQEAGRRRERLLETRRAPEVYSSLPYPESAENGKNAVRARMRWLLAAALALFAFGLTAFCVLSQGLACGFFSGGPNRTG